MRIEHLQDYFTNKATLLGWSGLGTFITSESVNFAIGAGLGVTMLISSIIMQYQKIQAMKNEERRKEELHRQNLKNKQDGEL